MKKYLRKAVIRLLRYSWTDIKFDYEGLTPEEKKLVSRDDFLELVDLIRKAEVPGEE